MIQSNTIPPIPGAPAAPAAPFQSQAEVSVHAGPFGKGIRLNNDQLLGFGGFLLLMPLMIAYAIRIIRRPHTTAAPALEAERFARLEQAVDAIAIEVERIGEAQRYQTKISVDRPERELRP